MLAQPEHLTPDCAVGFLGWVSMYRNKNLDRVRNLARDMWLKSMKPASVTVSRTTQMLYIMKLEARCKVNRMTRGWPSRAQLETERDLAKQVIESLREDYDQVVWILNYFKRISAVEPLVPLTIDLAKFKIAIVTIDRLTK